MDSGSEQSLAFLISENEEGSGYVGRSFGFMDKLNSAPNVLLHYLFFKITILRQGRQKKFLFSQLTLLTGVLIRKIFEREVLHPKLAKLF